MGLATAYLTAYMRESYMDNLRTHLTVQARMVSDEAVHYLTPYADKAAMEAMAKRIDALSGARVTIISPDGTVIGDSEQDPSAMENHATRPEVMAALAGEAGDATRLSATLGKEMMYVAVPITIDNAMSGVARVALPTSQVSHSLDTIRATILFAALAITILAAALAIVIARRSTRAVRDVTKSARLMAAGDLQQRVRVDLPTEAGELAKAFNHMAISLNHIVADLGAEKDKLAAILSTMVEGVVLLDQGDVVGMANPAAATLLGVPLTTGRRFIEMARDYDLHQILKKCLDTGLPQSGQVQLIAERRYLSITAAPMPGTTNVARRVVLVIHDVSDIRRTEKTRKEFVANVSHELRTPLASIKAAVGTLDDGALNDKEAARVFLKRIDSEVDRMNLLVSDLLDLSRLESGQVAPKREPVDLSHLVAETIERLRTRAETKGVRLKADVSESLPVVQADRNMIAQVLSNLLDNALKFTDRGGSVNVDAATPGSRVVVSVSDTGSGIAAEHLPRIFERFYKVDRARTKGGTGLGLAIAKHVVIAHGGEIWVDSIEGQGSTFYFSLPLL